MDVVAPSDRADLNAATGKLLILDWYTLILYPQEAVTNEATGRRTPQTSSRMAICICNHARQIGKR